MQEAVRTCLSKYADFNGRARRSEYWLFYLAIVIAAVVAAILDMIVTGSYILEWIVIAVTIVPNLAAGSRRLHDIDRSGWWQLLGLIPIVGWVLIILWLATDSDGNDNKYGPNPDYAPGGVYGSPPAG